MTKAHIWPVRVYFEDTDAGGVVYHANYLKFTERARTEMLRSLEADHAAMIRDEQIMFVVKQCTLEYHKPAKLDDALAVHTSVKQIGNASLTLQQNVYRDDLLLTTTEVVLVSVNAAWQACRIPASIRSKMETYMNNP